MSVELFWDLASKIGLPFALVVLALWTGRSGVWVWGREVEYERQQFRERLEEMAERARKREGELMRDRDYYRDIAFDVLHKAEHSSTLADRAVGLAERGRP